MALQPIAVAKWMEENGGFRACAHVGQESPWFWEETVFASGASAEELHNNVIARIYGAFINHGRLRFTPIDIGSSIVYSDTIKMDTSSNIPEEQ